VLQDVSIHFIPHFEVFGAKYEPFENDTILQLIPIMPGLIDLLLLLALSQTCNIVQPAIRNFNVNFTSDRI
jgi:hypothetical protein